jgi:hypothetical protein
MCAQARTVLADIDQELAAMGPGDAAWKGVEVAEEQAERRQIATSRRVVAEQLEQRHGCRVRHWRAWTARLPLCPSLR